MNLNIPIYRAKKVDSDEYVIGELVTDSAGQKIILEDCVVYEDFETDNEWKQGITNSFNSIIDPTTLSIHRPDMTDSEGNKIFASLSEDGKGGDIVTGERYEGYDYNYAKKIGDVETFKEVVVLNRLETNVSDIYDTGAYSCSTYHTNLKVIGIQE